MTRAAIADAERQAFRRRYPAQPEHRPVLLGMSSTLGELVRRSSDGDQFRIGGPEGRDVHFLERVLSSGDPLRQRAGTGRHQGLRLLRSKRVPVTIWFASGEVDRVGAYPVSIRSAVVLGLGKVRRPNIETGDRQRPVRELAV